MDKQTLKRLLYEAVDSAAEEVRSFAEDIAAHPELGFFEERTAAKLKEALCGLGLDVKSGLARTGLRADVEGGAAGPKVAIIGELDGIVCRRHPMADPDSGASHSCGHNLQLAALYAAASALAKTGLAKELSGTVSFLGTPAEEFIEVARRKELRDSGELVYYCGKQEFVRLGVFDDIDMSIMVHAGDDEPSPVFSVPDGGNGFRIFMLRYEGRQAHAAAAPHLGVNALYAAVAGINAVNALRETFRDEDHIRVHYIITKGGDSVNSVPDDVRIEGYVRAGSAAVIDETFDKVIRAFKAGGEALGAKCHVTSVAGDMPLNACKELNEIFAENAASLIGGDNVRRGTYFAASTDLGDIAHIMPAIQPLGGGVIGALHSKEFKVVDFEAAALTPAKAMLATVVDLLGDGARRADELLKNFKPVYTKEEYLRAMDRRFYSE
ncbi:MAG: amidohydrolase [Synergistaceae bacterium]|nr:amidohydrolase [Synergistaceae bacterium]